MLSCINTLVRRKSRQNALKYAFSLFVISLQNKLESSGKQETPKQQAQHPQQKQRILFKKF